MYPKNCPSKFSATVVPALIAVVLMVAGCGGGGSGAGGIGGNGTAAKHHLHGAMHGGQNQVAGASVTLYAAGDTGYGSSATALATTTTDSNGQWNIATFSCPTPNCISPETYLVATGGNSGSGVNSAIAMMAALGPCDQIQNSTTVDIDELTTIAAQWALQQFADSTGKNIGAPLSNLGGLSNAYATIANLDDVSPSDLSVSGGPSSFCRPQRNARRCRRRSTATDWSASTRLPISSRHA